MEQCFWREVRAVKKEEREERQRRQKQQNPLEDKDRMKVLIATQLDYDNENGKKTKLKIGNVFGFNGVSDHSLVCFRCEILSKMVPEGAEIEPWGSRRHR